VTLIIATPAGVWADRKITSDDGARHDPACKVAANLAIVVGFSGDCSAWRRAFDAVRGGEEDVASVATACKGAHGLVVRRGRLWLLEDGLVWPVRLRRGRRHYAVGSGAEQALAWLAGHGANDPEAIRSAHRYVASVRDDCGCGVDFRPSL
jgi:hypothetical protein